MLKTRILTALVLVPVVLLSIWYGKGISFNIFTAVLSFLISYEWMQIVNKTKSTSIIVSIVIAFFTLTYQQASFIEIDPNRIFFAAILIWVISFSFLIQHNDVRNKIKSKIALGFAIIILFAVSLISLHQINHDGPLWTICLFLLVWIADVGAYFTGKSIGKNKLAINISPGKTVEGFLGGVFLSSLFGMAVAQYFSLDLLLFAIAFGVIAAISAIGDLFASLIKRHGQVKDSGHLLPGHGGFLDRFDALIAATPFYFAFINYVIQSNV